MITSSNFISIDRNLFKLFKNKYDILIQLIDYIDAFNLFYSQGKLQEDMSFFVSNKKTAERLGFSHVKVIKQKRILEEMNFIKTRNTDGITFITLNIEKITAIQNSDYNIVKNKDYEEEEFFEEQTEEQKQLVIEKCKSVAVESCVKSLWNDLAEKYSLPKIAILKNDRLKKLDTVCKYAEITNVQFFEELDKIIGTSSFLRGDNDRGWKCGFDFFLNKQKFTKALEGYYNTKENAKYTPRENEALRKRAFISELFKDEKKKIEM